MIKIKFISLGCPKNEVDAEYMLGILLDNKGFQEINSIENADVIIINTCGFIEDAKQESIDHILQAARYKEIGNCKALIVTGCLIQRYKDEIIKKIPEIDAIIGTGKLDELKKVINQTFKGKQIIQIGNPHFDYKPSHSRKIKTGHFSYLKIAEGCNNNCSYCSIPYIRGNLKSRPIKNIYKEATYLAENGVKELILVAQDTTRYGIDIYDKPMLTKLLKKLSTIKQIKWIRLLYCYPEHIHEDLIDYIKSENKICNYLDLPIQHSENNIRKKMNREGTKSELVNTIDMILNKISEITLRTSIIVGFPGETNKDFNNLLSFVKNIEFDRLGAFRYSQEENTAAAKFNKQIQKKIKNKRYNKLMELQKKISLKNNKKYVGKNVEVIIDECYNNYTVGRTKFDAPEIDNQVYINNCNELNPGNIVKCKITGAYEYDLIGEKNNEKK